MIDAQKTLSTMALTVFALNGRFMTIAEQLAVPAGLTATRWQVLGAVLEEPLTQAGIARRMGISRQSVQRTATQLVSEQMLAVMPNPSHRKAMLLQPTEKGLAAIRDIHPQHAAFAERLRADLGEAEMLRLSNALAELRQTMDRLVPAEAE